MITEHEFIQIGDDLRDVRTASILQRMLFEGILGFFL